VANRSARPINGVYKVATAHIEHLMFCWQLSNAENEYFWIPNELILVGPIGDISDDYDQDQ
jgi:hypothetical protein